MEFLTYFRHFPRHFRAQHLDLICAHRYHSAGKCSIRSPNRLINTHRQYFVHGASIHTTSASEGYSHHHQFGWPRSRKYSSLNSAISNRGVCAVTSALNVRCYSTASPKDSSQTNSVKDGDQTETALKDSSDKADSITEQDQAEQQSVGIFQRFKNAYKEYGKVLIGVHVATSCVWYGSFVYAAASGVDVVPLLEKLGASETLIGPFKSSGVGNLAVGYLLYKIATPARYTVTIGGTRITVRKLREWGYMEQRAEVDSLRNLMKDGRHQMKVKIADKKEDIKERIADKKEDIKERIADKKGDIKERIADKKEDIKERIADKKEDIKERIADKKENIKGKVDEMRDEVKEKLDDMKSRRK